MKKTLAFVGASGWLLANLAALGFSLVHAIADLGIIFGSSTSLFRLTRLAAVGSGELR